jgi:hypothetical protein
MFTYGACKVSICPEFTSPQLFLDLGTALENLSGSKAFYHRYQPGDAIPRNGLHQKMDMIPISPDLQKSQLISLLNIQTDLLQHLIHLVVKYHAPVLGWKYQMVYQNCYIVASMYVLAHIGILRRKRRGIQPQGIELGIEKNPPCGA